jgi:quercetin dioxygenase-like cupin family protein
VARLTVGESTTELHAGAVTDIPQQRHDLEAVEDTVVVLTVLAD